MVFDIFSIGNSAFLAAVLNAVAMIAGTGHYATAAGVGALLGILMTLVRGLTQYDGRGIRYQDMLVSIPMDYMLASPITPMFEKGVVGRHEDGMKWNKAAMVEQAIQQRTSQWAGEQTLFTRIVR